MSSSQIAMTGSAGQVAPKPAVAAPANAAPAQAAAPAAQSSTSAEVAAPAAPKLDPEEMGRQLREAVSMLNQQMEKTQRNLGFALDEKLGRHIVTVTDKTTGEVVRRIPDEVVIRVAHSIEDLKGVLYSNLA